MASFFPPNTMTSLTPENNKSKVEIIEIQQEEIRPILSECQICNMDNKPLKLLPCCIGKKVCAECLFEMKNSKCPFCRKQIVINIKSKKVINWYGCFDKINGCINSLNDLLKIFLMILSVFGFLTLTMAILHNKYKDLCCLHHECKSCSIEQDIPLAWVNSIFVFIGLFGYPDFYIVTYLVCIVLAINTSTMIEYSLMNHIPFILSYSFYTCVFYTSVFGYILYINKETIKNYFSNCVFRNEYQNIDDIESYNVYTEV